MRVIHAGDRPAGTADLGLRALLARVEPERLRREVEELAVPRHAVHQRAANRRTRDTLLARMRANGFDAELQGRFDNVIARPPWAPRRGGLLLAAHYDSVPGSPGADDNASAVAALLIA